MWLLSDNWYANSISISDWIGRVCSPTTESDILWDMKQQSLRDLPPWLRPTLPAYEVSNFLPISPDRRLVAIPSAEVSATVNAQVDTAPTILKGQAAIYCRDEQQLSQIQELITLDTIHPMLFAKQEPLNYCWPALILPPVLETLVLLGMSWHISEIAIRDKVRYIHPAALVFEDRGARLFPKISGTNSEITALRVELVQALSYLQLVSQLANYAIGITQDAAGSLSALQQTLGRLTQTFSRYLGATTCAA